MKKSILSLLMITAMSTAAIAQDKTSPVTIASGMEGGGYHKAALAMSQRLEQRGYANVSVKPTNGSDAITLAACNGNADVWISQVDAIFTRFNEGCVLTPVADYGTEHAILLFPPESDLDELSDLDDTKRIAVDGIGSGTELFWKTIVTIENGDNGNKDAWAKASPIESSPDTLNTMANFGDIHAALLVRGKSSDHIKLLLQQGWTIGELWDKDINDQDFNTKALYESTKVTFEDGNGNKSTNYVYDVRSFIGVNKKNATNRTFKMDVAAASQ